MRHQHGLGALAGNTTPWQLHPGAGQGGKWYGCAGRGTRAGITLSRVPCQNRGLRLLMRSGGPCKQGKMHVTQQVLAVERTSDSFAVHVLPVYIRGLGAGPNNRLWSCRYEHLPQGGRWRN
jgi:hypothetical protein